MNFNERVYAIVQCIPEGKVASYGQIARLAGSARASRAVGYALYRNPYHTKVPCHRVVFKNGSLSKQFGDGGAVLQRQLLEAEGVVFTDQDHVDMVLCGWVIDRSNDINK